MPCLLLNKRLVETTGEEWILVCVHILQMVGNWGPFGHNLLPWCRGGRWPVEVVDNTLPPWAHLLCSSHLGHGINFFPNPWAKDIQISLWINRVILNLANCFVKKKITFFYCLFFQTITLSHMPRVKVVADPRSLLPQELLYPCMSVGNNGFDHYSFALQEWQTSLKALLLHPNTVSHFVALLIQHTK